MINLLLIKQVPASYVTYPPTESNLLFIS